MPRATITATATTEVKIAPKVRAALVEELKAYADLKAQRDAIDASMKEARATVEGLMEEIGETSVSVDGFKTTLIAPQKSKLDVKLLIKLGVKRAIIDKATTVTPGTPYVKITVPGAKAEEED